jgi:hypothetical protein
LIDLWVNKGGDLAVGNQGKVVRITKHPELNFNCNEKQFESQAEIELLLSLPLQSFNQSCTCGNLEVEDKV